MSGNQEVAVLRTERGEYRIVRQLSAGAMYGWEVYVETTNGRKLYWRLAATAEDSRKRFARAMMWIVQSDRGVELDELDLLLGIA